MCDGSLKKIYQYSFHDKKLHVLVYRTLGNVTSMDIDVVGENLYWTDSEKFTVKVMSLRTRARSKLELGESRSIHMTEPMNILVVNELSSLFLSRTQPRGSTIFKFPLNGKMYKTEMFMKYVPEKMVALTYGKINDMSFETISWIDRVGGSIEYAFTNGTLRTPTISNFTSLLKAPLSDAVIHEDKVYWRDRCTQYLIVTSIDPSHQLESNSTCTFGTNAKMAIFNRNMSDLQELLDNHECSWTNTNRKQCSHICLITQDKNKGECRCPEGLVMDDNGLTCHEEPDKPSSCLSLEFECKDKNCIREIFVCDGTPDCSEDEDEAESLCKNHKMRGSDTIPKPDKDTSEFSMIFLIIIVSNLMLIINLFVYFGLVHLWNKFKSHQHGHADPFYGEFSSRETRNL